MPSYPEFVARIIKKYWSPGHKILEVGCGPALLRNAFGVDYIGVDVTNEPYLPNLPRDVDIVCSAEDLKLDDSSVDIVIFKSTLYLLPNHAKCLQEAFRVLKASGKLIIFDYNKKTQKQLQIKEGHTDYPCWTQWKLRSLIQKYGFENPRLLIPENSQPTGMKKFYSLLIQEIFGTWAIVSADKRNT